MRMQKILLSYLTIGILTFPVSSQQQKPPEGGKPKDFVLPAKQAFNLNNGLKVRLVPYGTLPKVSVRVVVTVGNANEAADEVWLSDLTGDLMKEGTTSRSAEEIAREAAGMGGVVNIAVSINETSVSAEIGRAHV